jgi:hypothetical protein
VPKSDKALTQQGAVFIAYYSLYGALQHCCIMTDDAACSAALTPAIKKYSL